MVYIFKGMPPCQLGAFNLIQVLEEPLVCLFHTKDAVIFLQDKIIACLDRFKQSITNVQVIDRMHVASGLTCIFLQSLKNGTGWLDTVLVQSLYKESTQLKRHDSLSTPALPS